MDNFFKQFVKQTLHRDSICITGLAGVICTLAGPLGTFPVMPFSVRLLLWIPMCFLALVLGGLLFQVARTLRPAASSVRHGMFVAVGFCVIFPVFTLIISNIPIFAENGPDMSFAHMVYVTIAVVLSIGGCMAVVAHKQNPPSSLPRLYARLPDIGEVRVMRITIDDHYAEVYLSDGTLHRILMRFADAVQEMDQTDGFCVHRSHWISSAYIVETLRKSGREFVVMHCGTEVPISKTYRQNVIDAGYL